MRKESRRKQWTLSAFRLSSHKYPTHKCALKMRACSCYAIFSKDIIFVSFMLGDIYREREEKYVFQAICRISVDGGDVRGHCIRSGKTG